MHPHVARHQYVIYRHLDAIPASAWVLPSLLCWLMLPLAAAANSAIPYPAAFQLIKHGMADSTGTGLAVIWVVWTCKALPGFFMRRAVIFIAAAGGRDVRGFLTLHWKLRP